MSSAFLLASVVLAVTPGPAVVYLLARTLAHGRRAGFASLAGVALGNLGNAVGASLGLAALFAVSALAFTAVKLAGAAYLVYLGIRALRSRPAGLVGMVGMVAAPPSAGAVFRDGFLVALLNPKTALFFAAFLPQFIDASSSPMLQAVLLAGVFIAVAALTDTVYVLAASRLAGWRAAGPAATSAQGLVRRAGRYLSASVLIGLGLYTAFSGPRADK